MKPSSSTSELSGGSSGGSAGGYGASRTYRGLFGYLFTAEAVAEATGDAAWLQAMLDVEAALARAQARVGVISGEAAERIAAACRADLYDTEALGRDATAAGNPVVPLVRALTGNVSGDAARFVHLGATSQDILDTAAMLVADRALRPILADLAGLADACAGLAETHRDTVMVGRTLLQQALPITFGMKAASWLVGVDETRGRLAEVRDGRLAVQLGGATGTLASLGADGAAVLRALAAELELAEPTLPWHTVRTRIADLAGALGASAGVLGKVARDVALLAQTEVAEVAEPAAPGRGGSSTMPHKRNPVGSAAALACVHRVPHLVASLLGGMAQEHERSAGGWHAEWETTGELLRLVGGAAGWVREVVSGLEVHPDRMRANLDATGGLVMAEHVTTRLAGRLGRLAAHDRVEAACRAAVEAGRPLRAALLDDPTVREALTAEELDAALDPANYLGSLAEFIDRALDAHRAHPEGGAA